MKQTSVEFPEGCFTPGFILCVNTAFDNDELVQQFNRLRGCSIRKNQSPINTLVDDATGKLDHDIKLFVRFVYDCLWIRLAPNARENIEKDAMSKIIQALEKEPASETI